MKKLFGLIALMLLMACDDGDMTFKTFNFGTATVQSCPTTGIVYKTSGTQALILDFDPSAFIDIVTQQGTPRVVTLNAGNKLIYRNYTGNVTGAALCSDIPPASPAVAEEWIALPGGTITIVTTKRTNDDDELIGYSHAITLKSVTFTKGDETIIMEDNVFGTYIENLPYQFNFLDESNNVTLGSCTANSTTVFRVVGSETLLLALEPGIFPSVGGGTPVIRDLADDTDNNQVIFTTYTASASTALFCNFPPPVLNVKGQYFATAGQLKIITEEAISGGYDHIVYLVGAVFTNTIGETIDVTNGTNPEYRLGKYHTD